MKVKTLWVIVGLAIVLSALVVNPMGIGRVAGQVEQSMVTLQNDSTVYTWPNPQTKILGALPAGVSVPVTGRSADSAWWRISYPKGPGGNGWISAANTQPNQAAANAPLVNVYFVTATPEPCTYNASYVTDVTIPDGMRIGPAQSFTKVWQIRNTGTCPWEPGTVLVFNEGNHMSGPDTVALPALSPGDTTDVAVQLFSPTPPGTYKGIWMFKRPQGDFFGDRISVTINVPRPAPTRTPVPPPTPLPPPPPPVQPLQPLQPSPPPVIWPPPVITINFWSDQSAVGHDQCTVLHWSVNNVRAVYLDYRDKDKSYGVAGNDSRQVCPSSDGKRYRLRVIKQDNSEDTRDLTVDVSDAGKVSIDFSVDSDHVEPGACIYAHWTTENADRVRFFNGDEWKTVNRSDRRQVCPTHSTEYKLKVHDIYGGDHERSREVTVSGP